jgi:antirestriction protein ArdC
MVPGRQAEKPVMPTSPRTNAYARVTDAIVEAIESGPGNWRMPWHHSGSDVTRPVNVVSGRAYRGINTVSLWASAYLRHYSSGIWGTFNQWRALGAQVRKGERASPGVLWKEIPCHIGHDSDEPSDDQPHLFARSFSLFNADQVDGYVQPQPETELPDSERLSTAETFIGALGIETLFSPSSAYYRIDEDRIHMPAFSAFHEAHGFYATYIHECAHATGAQHRLDRDFGGKWTGQILAMEEMTAELTASFVLADLGIAHEPSPDQAAYIASWLRLLKDEPRVIFTAASKAQAAADWMHGRQT